MHPDRPVWMCCAIQHRPTSVRRAVQTAATPASDCPGPQKNPSSRERASRLIQSALLQSVSAALMPGQSGWDLSLLPALKWCAGRESIAHAASRCRRLLHIQMIAHRFVAPTLTTCGCRGNYSDTTRLSICHPTLTLLSWPIAIRPLYKHQPRP